MKEQELEKILRENYSSEVVKDIMHGYQEKRKVTLRINTIKACRDEVLQVLDEAGILYQEVSWYQDALIILNALEKEIRNLDIYKEGKIYLQSLSAMIPALILNPHEGENILDMTAAPGGKTSQIAALSNNKALITAVEKNKIRTERLKYNLEKLGVKKVTVLNMDAQNLKGDYQFDKILLDVPCSGSGTLYVRDGLVQNEFSVDLISRCVKLQEKLVGKAIEMLKPGGILVYATCSILKGENEQMIDKFIKKGDLELVDMWMEKFKDVPLLESENSQVMVVGPTQEYEGFFVACLRKL